MISVVRCATLIGAVVAVLMPVSTGVAQQNAPPPDFSSNFAGWVGNGGGGPSYEKVPGAIPPVDADPAHPFVANGRGQPSFRIADLTNANLMPWVKQHMKQDIDEILAGKKSAFTAQSSCVPAGVPFFMGYGGPDPIVFLQTPKEVWMFWHEDNQVRHVYLNVPHSKNLKPSWYGESVGHYEGGDTLVIDTIGLNDKTFVDNYRTPHTTQLHVIERWKVAPDAKSIEVSVYVEDPGAFTTPYRAVQRWLRRENATLPLTPCNENNDDHFNQGLVPLAEATTSDF
jgi:hypothetical protein